jgi:hypothetical protein
MLPMIQVGRHFEGHGRFFDLPHEIREMIYEYAVEGEGPSSDSCYFLERNGNVDLSSDRLEGFQIPRKFYFVDENGPIYRYLSTMCLAIPESIPASIRTSGFWIDTHENCKHFLNLMASVERGLQSVRELYLARDRPDSWSFGFRGLSVPPKQKFNPYIEILERCVGLRRLWLEIDVPLWRKTFSVSDDARSKAKDFENFVDSFSFEQLFHCRKIQTITLALEDWTYSPGTPIDDLVKSLVHWTRDEFQRRNNQAVHIRVMILSTRDYDYIFVSEE